MNTNTTRQIFFISYKESCAEENWNRLLEFHPDAVRLHGIKGIDKIHHLCNELSTTAEFWTVDGDNWIFDQLEWGPMTSDLLMFSANDPVHKEPTFLGGVKLWRKGTLSGDMSKGDFTLNATPTKEMIHHSLSTTRYNSSAYDAWKTAFRHCVKLDSHIFRSRPNAKNIDMYLSRWQRCNELDNGENNAMHCYNGYLDALDFVQKYNNTNELAKINDYDWLERYYESSARR